jgi:hypothetical protein
MALVGNPPAARRKTTGSAPFLRMLHFWQLLTVKKGRLGAELKAARWGRLVRNDATSDQIRISFHSM